MRLQSAEVLPTSSLPHTGAIWWCGLSALNSATVSGFGISAAVLHRLTRVRANYGSSARARAFRAHPSLARCLSRHLTSRAVSCCTLMQISCSASYLVIRYRAARSTHVSLLHVLALHCQEGCCGCSPPARRSRACTWLSLCH